MRATVTPALAMPNARPAQRLDGGRRARRDRQPEPQPEQGQAREQRRVRSVVAGRSVPEHHHARRGQPEPTRLRGTMPIAPEQEARAERPDGHRERQRAQDDPLLLRPGVAHAVHEDRGTHDRGRERIAGEQAQQHRAREDPVAEQARVEERVRGAQGVPDRGHGRDARRAPRR